MNNNNIRKIVQIALLIALFVLLGKLKPIPDNNTIKITLKNLPMYIGAVSLGTLSGAIIGGIGELTLQLIGYGFTATTLLWILPHTIVGAICGFAFEKNIIKLNGEIKYWVFIISIQLLLTFLNTIVMVVDSLIFGYYNPITIISSLVIRVMLAILMGIIYCIVIKPIVFAIKKIH